MKFGHPDGRVVTFDYDERSNLTGLTPPGKPTHSFEHTVRDLVSTYAPPDVGAGSNNTLYSYNALRQLSKATRPDNLELLLAYDKANRLHSLTVPRGTYTYSYDPSTCQINSIVAPDEVNLTYSYDGELIDQISWAGPINGTVGFAYDNQYRITQETVNGSNPIAYQYTNDHLLTQAGDLSLTYYHQSALLNSASLGNVSDSLEYNPFGELTRYSASTNSGDLYPVGYSFDQLARIKKPF